MFSVLPEHLKLQTQDAAPLESGLLETTLTFSQFNATRYLDAEGQNIGQRYRRDTLYWANLERGMGYGVEIGIGAGYALMLDQDYDPDQDGTPYPTYGQNFTDFKMNLLWRFLENSDRDLGLAYFIETVFPTGRTSDANFMAPGQGYYSVLQKLALTKDFVDTTLNADLGYDLPSGDNIGAARGRLLGNLAFGWQPHQQFQPFVEASYVRVISADTFGSDELSATLGATVLWLPELKTILGLEQSIAGRNVDMGTTIYLRLIFLMAS
jgi:hypothetical protein